MKNEFKMAKIEIDSYKNEIKVKNIKIMEILDF